MDPPKCDPVFVGDKGIISDMCAIKNKKNTVTGGPGKDVDLTTEAGVFNTLLVASNADGLVGILSDPGATLSIFINEVVKISKHVNRHV